ncbi:unnamed protein product [Rotaria sp. Silwood2]|nr:unnamed protein product [Rotaria sp. Silwood2]
MLLALWSAKVKPNVNVFLERTISDIVQLMTHGFWSGSSVLYPYDKNNLELRTHSGFIAAAKSAEEKSTEKRVANVEGVKGLSCLLKIISYPQQVVLDYMHLVCLGHVKTLIKRWCQLISKADITRMDSMLSMARFPHNIHVTYNESILAIDSWKAKHCRLLVLNLGILCLPTLNASHWTIYCLFVKLLHAPQSPEDIDFAEKLINYYCRTIADVYDESLELFSLHAHLHLPGQVRLHGGLSTSSAFTFESCIRYLKSKVHGTKHLASQIAYWYDIETIVKTTVFEVKVPCGVNEINFFNEKMNHYRNIIGALLHTHQQDLNQIVFYTRYKKCFLTFHTVLYDKPYKCRSYIVSYINDSDDYDALNYANIIVFYKYNNDYFALIQKYHFSRKKISHYVELPVELLYAGFLRMTSTNIYERHYLTKSRTKSDDNVYVLILFKCDNTFIIKKKSNLHGIAENGLVTMKDRNKNYVGYCLFEGERLVNNYHNTAHEDFYSKLVHIIGSLTEVEAAAERLDKEMNTDLESDCENIMNNHKLNKQQGLGQSSILKTPNNSSIEIDCSATMKNNKIQKKIDNDSIDSTIRSLATTSFDNTSKTYETPPISDKTVQKKHVQEASRKQGVVPAYQVLRDIQYITRDTENGQSEETLSSYEDDDDFETDDDDDSTERIIGITNSLTTAARLKSTSVNKVKSQQSKQSSSYAFKTTSHETTSKRLCNKQLFPSNSDGYQEIMVLLKSSILTNKDLARDMKLSLLDIKQLFVLIEKLDAKLNLIFDNQKKIQRALAKRKINVALFGGDFDAENQSQSDVPFERSLNYQKQDGTTIDLLQLYGVRTQIGRFVALVMDHVFTKHELCTITTNQLIKDERYNTIKEAVRSRFKLNAEEMNAEWPTIHESILQKRRNERIFMDEILHGISLSKNIFITVAINPSRNLDDDSHDGFQVHQCDYIVHELPQSLDNLKVSYGILDS